MQEHIQNELASFIANCDWEKIAPHFKEDAAYRVLDWIGCAVAGEHYPQVEIAQKYFIENGDQGNSTVIGHQTKCSPRTAAFLNGIAGHVCELDDGHRTAIGHPGSIAVPTALALGEHLNASGADVLKAVILGYEIFSRLASPRRWQEDWWSPLARMPKPSILRKLVKTGLMPPLWQSWG